MNYELLDELARKIYPGPATSNLESALTQANGVSEALEWLGDAIIEAASSAYVYDEVVGARSASSRRKIEGVLTHARTRLVNGKSLAYIGKLLGLDRMLVLTPGLALEDQYLEDAVEAIVGAMYLDYGYDSAHEFCLKMFARMAAAPEVAKLNVVRDAKGLLQTYVQRRGGEHPEYRVTAAGGTPNNPTWEVLVRIPPTGEFIVTKVENASKKDAEKEAALEMLRHLEDTGALRNVGLMLPA